MGLEPPAGAPAKRGRGRPRKDGLPPMQRKSLEPVRTEGSDTVDGGPLRLASPRCPAHATARGRPLPCNSWLYLNRVGQLLAEGYPGSIALANYCQRDILGP